MSIFAAAAQKQLRDLNVGMTNFVADVLGVRSLTASGLWNKTLAGVAGAGLVVMEVGSQIVSIGWKIGLYGLYAWAAVGIFRGVVKFIGVLGNEVLRAIPDAIESAA